jgi:hypothetical protein
MQHALIAVTLADIAGGSQVLSELDFVGSRPRSATRSAVTMLLSRDIG